MNTKYFFSSTVLILSSLLVVPGAFASPSPVDSPLMSEDLGDYRETNPSLLDEVPYAVVSNFQGSLFSINLSQCKDGTRTCRDIIADYEMKRLRWFFKEVNEFSVMKTTPNAPFCEEQSVYKNTTYYISDDLDGLKQVTSSCEELRQGWHISPQEYTELPQLVGRSVDIKDSEDGLARVTYFQKGTFSSRLEIKNNENHELGSSVVVRVGVTARDANNQLVECSAITVNGQQAVGDSRYCRVHINMLGNTADLTPKVSRKGLYSVKWGVPVILSEEISPDSGFIAVDD